MRNLRRNFLVCLAGILFSALLLSCGDKTVANSTDTPAIVVEDDTTAESIPRNKVAICVYPVAGLRKSPGQKNYNENKEYLYITPIDYGEMVEILGEYDTLKDENNRVYMKVRLQDGSEGWVYEYLFEKNGRRAVMIKEAEIYRRPDLMTLRDARFQPGEIIIALEEKDNWLHVSGRKKEKKGWIRIEPNMSFALQDIRAAHSLFLAKEESRASDKAEKLQAILENGDFDGSPILDLVKDELQHLATSEELDGQAAPLPEGGQ
ncbi:MAG: hypothetical protein AAFR61_10725 [Bacteroidota bacterium]